MTGAKIADDAVDSEHIADSAVLQSRINDGAVNNAKLADNAVSLAKMQNESVGTSELVNDSVTAAKVAADVAGDGLGQAVGGALKVNVDDSTLEISSDTVQVKALGIDTAQLAADAVDGTKIADDAIDSEHITDGSVDMGHLAQWDKVRVYRDSSDQTVSQSSEDAVLWNAESYDTNSMHSTSSNTSRLVAKSAGDYEVYCQLYLNLQGGTGGQAVITLKVNGSTEWAVTNNGWTLDDTENTFVIGDVLALSANDYVEVMVENTDTVGNDVLVKAGEGRSFCVMRRVA